MNKKLLIVSTLLITVVLASDALAGTGTIANNILDRFNTSAASWATAITAAASRIFWILVTMSMVWTFGLMALRRADLGEFFAELIRFIVFVGFFWWLLTNAVTGQNIAGTIISGLQQLGQTAGSLPTSTLGPDTIVDIGFAVYNDALSASATLGWREFTTSFMLNFVALAVLMVLVLVAVNMLLLLISAWLLLYVGIFFLGFGGAKWTSDIAINYFKTVLGVGVQLMTMILLASIGRDFIADIRAGIATIDIGGLTVILISAVILLVLVNKVPPLIAGVITGSSVGNLGIGGFGAGAVVGAMSTAAGAMITSAAAFKSAAMGSAGGAQAIYSAVQAARSASDPISTMPTTSAMAVLGKGAFDSLSNKIATETTGGKIATAIKNMSPGKDDGQSANLGFYGNSLAGDTSKEADPEREVAAFRDRT